MLFITFLRLASGRWLLASGLWHLASGFWPLVSGFLWPLVPGLWVLASGLWSLASENARKSMKMGMNGSAMSPHGLIFDEDGAISCPMPPDTLPTPFGVVFMQF